MKEQQMATRHAARAISQGCQPSYVLTVSIVKLLVYRYFSFCLVTIFLFLLLVVKYEVCKAAKEIEIDADTPEVIIASSAGLPT